MNKKHVAIALPASIISDTPHLREKTSKIGLIGRAAAIFNVSEIIIYQDEPKSEQTTNQNLIATLLTYMETPQYLRKRLFKIKPELKYVGIIPPLRTPHHPLHGKISDLHEGVYREGLTTAKTPNGTLIDIGTKNDAIIPNTQIKINKRLTVKIIKITSNSIEVQIVNSKQIPYYWGYKVTAINQTLSSLIEQQQFNLTIGTSKFASRFQDAQPTLHKRWQKAQKILILFGAPHLGLHEIMQKEGKNITSMVDYMVNSIPNQGTETVRTEEAIFSTLAILNITENFT